MTVVAPLLSMTPAASYEHVFCLLYSELHRFNIYKVFLIAQSNYFIVFASCVDYYEEHVVKSINPISQQLKMGVQGCCLS